jgi:hypothetical protein
MWVSAYCLCPNVLSRGGTNQTIIWLIDKFSLFEINRYLINLNQTVQIIQKAEFWGKNRRLFSLLGNFEIQIFVFFGEIQNWSGFAGIALGVHCAYWHIFGWPLCRNGAIVVINMLSTENKYEIFTL